MRVGITGQSGFIGTHLFNSLILNGRKFEPIPFKKEYFADQNLLIDWVAKCDVIIHLAAISRHEDSKVLYNTNIDLVKKIIVALRKTKSKAHIIFTSSIQEALTSNYGKSKKKGRQLFCEWAKLSNVPFTGLLLPNVFGPFGRPNYASVIATFSYKLTHKETPKIIVDAEIKLIYIDDLVKIILGCINNKENNPEYYVPFTNQKKVSEILNLLEYYNECYNKDGKFPTINSSFDFNLFATFTSYLDQPKTFPFNLKTNNSKIYIFIDSKNLNVRTRVSLLKINSKISFGDYIQTHKIERLFVIKGSAQIKLQKLNSKNKLEIILSSKNPSVFDIPIWYKYSITNNGKEDLLIISSLLEYIDPTKYLFFKNFLADKK